MSGSQEQNAGALPALGQRIRHLVGPHPIGKVIDLRSDPLVKPITAEADDGSVFYAHADQWEPVLDARVRVAEQVMAEVWAQLEEASDETNALVESAAEDSGFEYLDVDEFTDRLRAALRDGVENAMFDYMADEGVAPYWAPTPVCDFCDEELQPGTAVERNDQGNLIHSPRCPWEQERDALDAEVER